MILTAGHVLALGAGALLLGCISFMHCLNSTAMWIYACWHGWRWLRQF